MFSDATRRARVATRPLIGRASRATFRHNGGRGGRTAARLCALALAALASVSSPALAKPHRIVSLNQCADELILRLADRDAIASVTWLSQDPREANMAAAAAGLPANDGLAEQALAYKPDLVLVGAFTDPATVALLRRVGAPVVELDVPETLDGVRRQIRAVAAAVGEPARGEALVAELDRRLAAVEALVDASRPPLRAIVLRPGGFTVGPGSLIDEIMRRAGMINLAARLDVGAYPQLPLEKLVMLDADVAIVDDEGFAAPALAEQALAHPVLAALSRRITFAPLPSRLWTCPGPALADAARVLAEAGEATRRARAEK
jgi:iron complex transport system substrate-binding protein